MDEGVFAEASFWESVLDRPDEALVELFDRLLHELELLPHAEFLAREDPREHERRAELALGRLRTGELAALWTELAPDVLALLVALDRHCWELRVGPSNRVARSGRGYMLRTRRFAQRRKHAEQRGKLQRWLAHHWIVPARVARIEVGVRLTPASLAPLLPPCAEGARLRVYLGAFSTGLHFEPALAAGNFFFTGIAQPRTRWLELVEHLQRAVDAGANVVLFPELTITPALRDELLQWLDRHAQPERLPQLLVPGSFHELPETDRGQQLRVNRTRLFTAPGHELLAHDKLTSCCVNVEGAAFEEHIAPGHRIELLETPLGLLGLPICLDFIEQAPPFPDLWQKLGLDWAFVPAMDRHTEAGPYRQRARELDNAHGTATLVANQLPPVGPAAGGLPGAGFLGAFPEARGRVFEAAETFTIVDIPFPAGHG